MSWFEAVEFCEDQDGGAFLAEPKTKEQLEFITSITYIEEALTGIQAWWVGLSDLGHEGEWFWQNSREDATISTWEDGYPTQDEHNTNDCAALVSVRVPPATREYGARYRDYPCAERLHSLKIAPICQRRHPHPPTTTPTPTTTPLRDCPSGWLTYDDSVHGTRKCFQHFSSSKYATDAEKACMGLGGHLASIHSKQEEEFLQRNLYHSADVWVGGVDPHRNGQWEWTDGSKFDYANWITGQPDGGQYYIQLDDWGSIGSKIMRDIEYSNNHYYICQLIM